MNPGSVPALKTSRSTLTDCGACIQTKFDPETQKYTLYTFVEAHNHELIGPEFMDFSSKRRILDFLTQQFIHQLSLNKIGPTVAHKIQCSLKGGHHNVCGSKTEFKNFARAVRIFIGDSDAKLVMDTLEEHTKNLHNIFYDSLVVGNKLKSFFWADDVSLCNYETFCEVLALMQPTRLTSPRVNVAQSLKWAGTGAITNGLDTNLEKSREQLKVRKNRAKKI
ncbi:hypothetical protein SSX86_008134 [Deinandra increscens subsp. villosa]|uniref:Protein FAR1-RELATED SEQUENCE n=1 Tax=Deinandra increscens subsp. villosa TaxID=3103831 RepID=A0AAP0DEQ6_9ASTR